MDDGGKGREEGEGGSKIVCSLPEIIIRETTGAASTPTSAPIQARSKGQLGAWCKVGSGIRFSFGFQFKQKRAKEKYGDQDEDEKQLMMEFLAVRRGWGVWLGTVRFGDGWGQKSMHV